MKKDFGNQLANLIRSYLPNTDQDNIGQSYNPLSFSVSGNTLTMTLDPADYNTISEKINNIVNPNSSFSINNIHLKNYITEFLAYPTNNLFQNYFAFQVSFKLPHKFKKDQIVTFKDFTDTNYNINYRVLSLLGKRKAIIVPETTVNFVDITTGLGFLPVKYTTGFNGIQSLIDDGANNISFNFDVDLIYTTNDINDIDISFIPKIIDYQDSIKVINKNVFVRNLVNQPNTEYLVIDTTSLAGSPIRSNSNTTDSNYSSFSKSGFHDRNYTLSLYYILERKEDDLNNQTFSGSDIMSKQINMSDSLTSIIRQFSFDCTCEDDKAKMFSSITLESEAVSQSTPEGSVIIEYVLQFVSKFLPDILLDLDQENTYPINSVKINTDEINFA
jgi:hypothetical protein